MEEIPAAATPAEPAPEKKRFKILITAGDGAVILDCEVVAYVVSWCEDYAQNRVSSQCNALGGGVNAVMAALGTMPMSAGNATALVMKKIAAAAGLQIVEESAAPGGLPGGAPAPVN